MNLSRTILFDGSSATARNVGRWVVVQTNNGRLSASKEFATSAEAIAAFGELTGPAIDSTQLTSRGYTVGHQ